MEKWSGYTDEEYDRLLEERYTGQRVDRVTTGGGSTPFITSISGGRVPMLNNQELQYMPLIRPEPPQQMSGTEACRAKALRDIRFDAEGEVVIVEQFPLYQVIPGQIDKPTGTGIVYRCMKTNKLCYIEIPDFITEHPWVCASVHQTPVLANASRGQMFHGNEVIAQTSTRTADGNIAWGRELNVGYWGRFGTNEDGVMMSKTAAPKLASERYDETETYLHGDDILLNLYGNDAFFKPTLSVGDVVPQHQTVLGIRSNRRLFAPVNLTRQSLSTPQHPYDRKYRHCKGGTIVEIEVIRNGRGDFKHLPKEQVMYLDAMAASAMRKHRRILEIDQRERREQGKDYQRHPSWHIAVRNAEARLTMAGEHSIANVSAQPSIRDKSFTYYVRIVSKSVVIPTLGHKLTGRSGNKAVVCSMLSPERMGVDQWGRYLDIIANPAGVSNRNNPSQLTESYINDACYHTRRHLLAMNNSKDQLDHLMEFYRLCFPEVYRTLTKYATEEDRYEHLETVLQTRIDGIKEAGEPGTGVEIVDILEDTPYNPPFGRVKFVDNDGVLKESKAMVRVANQYIYVLERIGVYSSACAIPVHQPRGFSAKLTKDDKAMSYISTTNVRSIGGTETRLLFGNVDPDEAAAVMNRGNSIEAGKDRLDSIFKGALMVLDNRDRRYSTRGLDLLRGISRAYGCDLTKGEE